MFLFTEMPFLDRPARAAAAGFAAVEMWWPFEGPDPAPAEVDLLVRRLERAGVQLACCNLYGGDVAAGDRGLLGVPAGRAAFEASTSVAALIAEATGCQVFNGLYGNRLRGLPHGEQEALALENLRLACEALAPFGAGVVLEALNPHENPSYALRSSADAIAALRRARAVGLDNCSLLVDLYQYARIGERPAAVLAAVAASGTGAAPAIGHVQIADVPGRTEPGSGELGVDGLVGPLVEAGWDGWVGLEYRPTTTSDLGLAWLAPAERAVPPRRRR